MSETRQLTPAAAPNAPRETTCAAKNAHTATRQRRTLLTITASLWLGAMLLSGGAIHEATAAEAAKELPNGKFQGVVIAQSSTKEGASIGDIKWCGPSALVYHFGYPHGDPGVKPPASHGYYWVDVSTKSKKKFEFLKDEKGGFIRQCTRNGEWAIFSDSIETEKTGIWAYHIPTGKKELLVAGSDIPPWPKPYFLRVTERESSPPRVEVIQIPKEHRGTVVWLADGSLFDVYRPDPKRPLERAIVVIENPGDKQKQHVRQLTAGAPELRGGLSPTQVLGNDHIYATVYKFDAARAPSGRYLRKCEIRSDVFNCIPAIPGDPNIKPGFQISTDEREIYFQNENRPCIWRHHAPSGKTTCLIQTDDTVVEMVLSPDNKKIAFEKLKKGAGELVVVDVTANY